MKAKNRKRFALSNTKVVDNKKKTKELNPKDKKSSFAYGNYSLEVLPQGFIEEFWTKQRCTS